MRFITTLLLIYLIWQVVKWVFRIAFRYWIRKNAGKAFYYSSAGGFGGYQPPPQGRPEGEIRIDSVPQPKTKGSPGQQDLGEYVDFEEVR